MVLSEIGKIDFSKNDGLIPAIVQDATTSKVLMLGYMNERAIEETLESRKVTFFSRSKNRLWTKGETSGNFLELVEIRVDCDRDTLLVKAHPAGPVCHTGQDTCFAETNDAQFVRKLEDIIVNRKQTPKEGSYTTKLFSQGINKIAQKVGEEAVELIIEAKDDDRELFLNEAADLLYHLLVLLTEKGCRLSDIEKVLEQRHGR